MSARPSREARAGAAMGVATLAMAGAAGLQAILYLSSFGVTERTDGFFAAFALYTVFGIFSQSIRVTSVPLLVGRERLMRGSDFAATLALIAVPVIVACGPLAGLLAQALAPGLEASERAVTEDALRILGAAMVLQLAAAGAATLLGVWDRFETVAGGYIAGAAAGVVAYFAVEDAAGELVLGWSMLAMAVVTCGWMLIGLGRSRTRSDPGGVAGARRLLRNAGLILGRTVVYFVINGLFLVTLAFASSSDPGDATVLSYGYLFASYLVAGTSVAVGVSRVPDMTRGAQSDWTEVVADTVPHGFRYGMLVSAPALAALVAAGAGLLGELVPDSLPAQDVETLRVFASLLGTWLVAALLVNFALPALFAVGRARLVNLLALPIVALHALATLAGERLFGVEGVVGAFFVAPLVFGAVLLATGAGARRGWAAAQVARDAVGFTALAAGAFAAAIALALALPSGIGKEIAVIGVGSAIYLAAARVAAPRQLAVLLGSRRSPAAPGEAGAGG